MTVSPTARPHGTVANAGGTHDTKLGSTGLEVEHPLAALDREVAEELGWVTVGPASPAEFTPATRALCLAEGIPMSWLEDAARPPRLHRFV